MGGRVRTSAGRCCDRRGPERSPARVFVREDRRTPGLGPERHGVADGTDAVHDIREDSPFAKDILRLVNEASPEVLDDDVRLNKNTVKNLVLSFAILQQLPIAKPFGVLSPVAFWEHSVAVGVIAKWLAEFQGVRLTDQEDYFVGGLLHDLGKIPLNHQYADESRQALALARQHHWSGVHAESVIFGFDHSVVGGLIARKWRLSPAFIDVLAYHHRPAESPDNNPQLVFMVALADLYARMEAARLMVFKACELKENGVDFRLEASMAKYLSVAVAREVALWAADLFGAASVMLEHPVHKFPLDVWASSLGEGTQDVQKLVIFRELLERM